jgi:2-oxo-3-hexenedioate decarboxylase
MNDDHLIEAHAASLLAARISGVSVAPLTTVDSAIDVPTAYAVQWAGLCQRLRGGERVVGAKLGLTSRAKQQEVGFEQPIYSWLTDAMQISNGLLPVDRLRAPRVEPELALILGSDLDGQDATAENLLAAIIAVAPAIEVLNSRYPVNAPSLPDVIADGASAAAFIVGPHVPWRAGEAVLNDVECTLWMNGQKTASARAAEALGGPLLALKALRGAVLSHGRKLTAGSVILTGGLTRAYPIGAGDQVEVVFDHDLGSVKMKAVSSSDVHVN